MKQISVFAFILLLLASCGTRNAYINVLVPPAVTVPDAAVKAGVLNRALPDDKNKVFNAMHQILSLETYAMLEEGSAESLSGLREALLQNKRFDSVTILDTIAYNGSSSIGLFAAPLSWDVVDALCKKNNLDVLIVLELFDTELKINPGGVPLIADPVQVVNSLRQVNLTTVVKTGWRVYEPAGRTIRDEFVVFRTMNFNAAGNILIAADAMLQRKTYVKQAANINGYAYAERLMPHWFREQRDYYAKGGGSLKIAARKVKTGNWTGAAEYWKQDVSNPKRKTAGRACFNMALASEINSNLDQAIVWSQKAYEDYKIRKGLDYVRILKARQAQLNAAGQ